MLWTIGKVLLGLIGLVALTACVQHVRNSGTQAVPERSDAMRLATLNVHYIVVPKDTGAWSRADWERRKGPMDAAFKAVDADVFGFQEMESFQFGHASNLNLARDWLLENNPGYAAGASGDADVFPSTQPIFYRTDRFRLLDQGWYFFSDTPDVIYSRTFNGSFPAFASWVWLEDRDGARFRVVNVHFEFSSGSNRRKSAALVAERSKPWIDAGETVFLIGDLNARQGAETLRILEEVGFVFAPIEGATYHLNRGLNLFGAIDHIATVGAAVAASDPVVLRQKFEGAWPTDHYPVLRDFRLTD